MLKFLLEECSLDGVPEHCSGDSSVWRSSERDGRRSASQFVGGARSWQLESQPLGWCVRYAADS